MTDTFDARVRALFDEALEQPVSEHAAFLSKACGADQELYDEVASLLEFLPDREGDVLLAPPAAEGLAADLRSSLQGEPLALGERLGPYVIRGRLGEGGMSVVYSASQSEPVRRDVAIKVLKPGMDSAAVLARFERERDVLAALEHPHIARIFDAGVTSRDQPFVVMELIRGEALLTSCERNRLGLRERLTLFVTICQAVHHAHMRGVIHRDLKPSNLLVVEHASGPAPKVIDFGVAKALEPGSEEHTRVGQPVGTPAYMSPEQWAATGDLDVRSDVYSLGVVLYELLTGQHPYGLDATTSGDVQRVRHAQETVDVPRGSTTVTRTDSTGPSSVGDLPKASLARALRGGLDWILLKALARDRNGRYGSALALADDVQRHLDRRTVEARPPSLLYRARQYGRRHPALAVAVLLMTIGAVAASVAGAYHVRRLGEELQQKRIALGRAEAAEAAARRRADELERVLEFRTDQLADIQPHVLASRLREGLLTGTAAADRETLRELLQPLDMTGLGVSALRATLFTPTREAITRRFADEPLLQARLLEAFARSIVGLGDLLEAALRQSEALQLRLDALGTDHPDSLASQATLGGLLSLLGRGDEGEPLIRQAVAGLRATVGVDDPRTLRAVGRLAFVLTRQGRLDESEPFWREAYEGHRRVQGEDHLRTLETQGGLASLLLLQGHWERAHSMHRDVLERSRRVLGDHHNQTLMALNDAGYSARNLGRLDEALALTSEALDGWRQLRGEDHPSTQLALNNVANLEWSLGRLDLAEALFRKSLEVQLRTAGSDQPGTVVTLFNLGNLCAEQGRPDEAEEHLLAALRGSTRRQGRGHPDTLRCLAGLMLLTDELGRLDDAEAYARELVELGADVLPDGDESLVFARELVATHVEPGVP